MLPKPAIACLAAIAFEATTALVARPRIWDWPPTEGRNMPNYLRLCVDKSLSSQAKQRALDLPLSPRLRSGVALTVSGSLPRAAKRPPIGPGWIHEIKHGGFRILAERDAAGVTLHTQGL
jgi:ATP-dependent DNA ligase